MRNDAVPPGDTGAGARRPWSAVVVPLILGEVADTIREE